MRAITSITVRATANGLPDGSLTATRTEPTRAVPSEDPRLETLRASPEISPWSASGKLDHVDRGGQHDPDPGAEQQQPRYPLPDAGVGPDQDQQRDQAEGGGEEPGDDQPPLRVPPGEPVGAGRGGQDPDGGRGEH
jgi:hypothetical protein